ncbi:hypothetical protein C8R47DRAFT_1118088 [Mycena vitilis]|nr:hypothetical protein C8R47DRAFT_1118088 [Mycena vitilis]
MSLAEAPLLLCRICSAWRNIAIRMPRLWNHLHVSWPFVAETEGRKQAMAQWLERSAQLPLAVSAAYDARSDDTHVILDSFLRFSARWHTVPFSNMPVEVFFKHRGPAIDELAHCVSLTNFRPRQAHRYYLRSAGA